jgi:hypothetical protein
MELHLLGLYTSRLELFKFFFVFTIGFFIWSAYLFASASGSVSRRRSKLRALIFLIVSGILMVFMGLSWLASKTNYGWWFERF